MHYLLKNLQSRRRGKFLLCIPANIFIIPKQIFLLFQNFQVVSSKGFLYLSFFQASIFLRSSQKALDVSPLYHVENSAFFLLLLQICIPFSMYILMQITVKAPLVTMMLHGAGSHLAVFVYLSMFFNDLSPNQLIKVFLYFFQTHTMVSPFTSLVKDVW